MNEEVSSPGVAKTFGIIHLVFAGLGAIFLIIGIVSLATGGSGMSFGGDAPGAEEIQQIQQDLMALPAFKANMYIGIVVGVLMTVLLVVAGLHLLKHQPSGRTLSLAYAGIGIAYTIISVAFNYLAIMPSEVDLYMASGLDENMVNAMVMTAKFKPFFGICCGLPYPLIILIFMLPAKFARSLTGSTATAAPEVIPPPKID